MKFFSLIILLNLFSIIVSGQTPDTIRLINDTTKFRTANPFMINKKNYETISNSFITGNSYAIIRSQDNPEILVDGIPVNPLLVNNTHYNEFLGSMHLLSYDLQEVTFNTLQSEDKIVSGNYNNSLSFKSQDIDLGDTSHQFEINNFTTLAYQNFDTVGYSTILNFSAQQGFKKFGYRFSLNNGYQNDIIPENGLQRYGSNIKLKYEPDEQISFTGFLDYTNFQDFNRSRNNNLKSNRLLSYINADITFSKWLSLYSKFGLNNISEVSERDLNYDGGYWHVEQYVENYFEKNIFKYKSSYFDIGLSFNKYVVKNTSLSLKLGYNQNNTNYFNENETDYQHSNGSFAGVWSKSEPKDSEKVLYTSVKLRYKYLSVSYLFNRTNYKLSKLFFKDDENKSLNNQLLSLNFDLIRKNTKDLNSIGFQFKYGKLINYSIILQPIILNPLPGYQEPEWITTFNNDNIQLDFYSSLFKNRIDINFSVYQKSYKTFNHFFQFGSWNGTFSFLADVGEISKSGYELNSNFHIVHTKALDWFVDFSYCENGSKLAANENLMFQIADTVINNKIISVVSNFAYQDFKLYFEFEGKNGFDMNLYRNNISIAEPFSYWERTQISEINNEGIPISESIENYEDYITNTEYFILKQIGLEYQIRDNEKGNDYEIGLQYNKMRRIYLYMNDIEKYQEQFQKPSFFSAISLSFKMRF